MLIDETVVESRGEILEAASKALNRGDPFILATFPRGKPIELCSQMPSSREIEELIGALLELRQHVRKNEMNQMLRGMFKEIFGHEPGEGPDES